MLALSAQAPLPADGASLVPLFVVCAYLGLLVVLGLVANCAFRGTSSDYFLAGRTIGPFLMLMSLFGTTTTAFSMVGSTAEAYDSGIGVYGLMASSSGLVHPLMFFLVGIKLWAIGKRYDYVTQVQFFRARFQSDLLGYLMFPILAGLVVIYLLMGLAGAGTTLRGLTAGMFPGRFPGEIDPESGELAYVGAVPPRLSGLVISAVVLFYVFSGGIRGAVWANTLLTIVFIATALVAVWLVARSLGGLEAAAAAVAANAPEHLAREGRFGHLQFASYLLVPLSAGMFPHLFQHWLTARDARAFRQSLVWFPICLAAVWLPCVLIGLWAAGEGIAAPGGNSNAVLAVTVGRLVPLPAVSGLLAAGVLAAIMSGLDSQFVCLGAMFTHDVLRPFVGQERFSDRHWVLISRLFIAGIVVVVYALSLLPQPNIFDLGVWCFSGFAGLVPLLLAALYWKGATRAGALASVLAMSATWLALFYRGMLAPLARGEPIEGEYLVAGMTPVVLVIAAAGLALWLVSLVTAPPPREHVERFFIEPA